MNHTKKYHQKEWKTIDDTIVIEGPVETDALEDYTFHSDLHSFRPADQQKEAIIEIAGLEEGRIIIARKDSTVVGYTTFLYPDPLERWSEGNMDELIELGAIEVIPAYRGSGIGKGMLEVAMLDDTMEDYIIITTEYYWHWDLKGTGLDVWEYRKMMERMMNSAGLVWYATDDPEISSHPANCLMVRIGKRVKPESIQQFDNIRFMNRWLY